jgi:DNA (cytosine-5)-methyltransferase 1
MGDKPRLLDLFCGAGGAAMGYARAGFEVVGVDIEPQPRYPFEFHQADALTFPLAGFDAVHASPPCQHYANVTRWTGNQADHADLVAAVRSRLAGRVYVIENVIGAPLVGPVLLCGSMFGLRIRRHRLFEASVWLGLASTCRHRPDDLPFIHKGERAYADAMGCQWMSNREGRQAIPPAYTEFIGRQLLRAVGVSVASPAKSCPERRRDAKGRERRRLCQP